MRIVLQVVNHSNVIIDNNDAPLVLETDYKDNVVELNSNSQTKIGFTSKLTPQIPLNNKFKSPQEFQNKLSS